MHTFYYPDHIRHNVTWLHHPDFPHRNTFYSEVPKRAILLHEAMKTADFGPITSPADFGIYPISEVHKFGLIHILQTAHRNMFQGKSNQRAAIADTYSVRHTTNRLPRSVHGLLGHYSFDVGAPIFEHTWDAAYWGAQAAISAAAQVHITGDPIAYALCRPPGHHAMVELFGGFCYLNNAAIAANWLAQQGQRVAVLDIDYHHGNGTQDIFYRRSDVLVCSIHANPMDEYPYYWGHADEFGQDNGRHYNFNFPLPLHTGETQYLKTLHQALEKISLFVPDLLLVSLGFDTLDGDPISFFKLSPDSFEKIGKLLSNFNVPKVVVQEGGYKLDALQETATKFFKGILG